MRIAINILLIMLLFFYGCKPKQNRLSKASSPYLKEHADNPVDWYEWGDDALAMAKKQNKPLLISIGYAACHWCHQMEKESFMDTAVARIMNDNFICIKVDREERPDIDKIYMSACQLISGNTGWPLNAFALPDGKPFYAGSYYVKNSWLNLLQQIAITYQSQPQKVNFQAQSLANGVTKLEFKVLTDSSSSGNFDKLAYQHLFQNLYQKIDLVNGGFKGNPKFPNAQMVEFLLQYHFITQNKEALDAANTTLTKMALGGIYDQVGGGFARYSLDSLWHIPHFEKMLYDNAQLLSVYAHAYQVTGNKLFKNVVEETTTFLDGDLKSKDGGYFSSLNADTKQGEGDFYGWDINELKTALPSNWQLVSNYYNTSNKGNWQSNKNILYANISSNEYALTLKIDTLDFDKKLSLAKATLLSIRNKREKPSVDDKILTSWNSLLINGFLNSYVAFGNKIYLQNAISTAQFLEKMVTKDGKVWHNYKDGKWSVEGFLDDYSLLANAYIRLYQVTFDKHWLDLSKQITGIAINNFYDLPSGMFYYASKNGTANLIKKIEITDNAMPASNAVTADVLYKLGVYYNIDDYKAKSTRMLARLSKQLAIGDPRFFTSWYTLAAYFSYGTNDVAIMGEKAIAKNLELQKEYLPLSLFVGANYQENLPILEAKFVANKTRIYVCTNGSCKTPTEEIAIALQELKLNKKNSLIKN